MFIRVKKIYGNEYGYLVRNRWTKKGPRQKTRKYLGKVIKLEKVKNMSLLDILKYKNLDFFVENYKFKDIVRKLAELELLKHGFKSEGKGVVYRLDDYRFDLSKLTTTKAGKNVVLRINEGLLCGKGIELLMKFLPKEGEQQTAVALAEAFVNAGIDIEKEVFIKIFQKIY